MHQSAVTPVPMAMARLRLRSTRSICSWMGVGTMFIASSFHVAVPGWPRLEASTFAELRYRSQELRYRRLAALLCGDWVPSAAWPSATWRPAGSRGDRSSVWWDQTQSCSEQTIVRMVLDTV